MGRSEDGEGMEGEGDVVQTEGGAGVWQRVPVCFPVGGAQ